MVALAALTDPVRGVRFSPYSFVDDTDVVLSRAQLRDPMKDSHVRVWGAYDGSGDPINLGFRAYYRRFVWTRDFTVATRVGVDRGERTGNTVDNIATVYPHAHFVELYDAGVDGSDWHSLRLVFEGREGDPGSTLWLVGIIHGEWTT